MDRFCIIVEKGELDRLVTEQVHGDGIQPSVGLRAWLQSCGLSWPNGFIEYAPRAMWRDDGNQQFVSAYTLLGIAPSESSKDTHPPTFHMLYDGSVIACDKSEYVEQWLRCASWVLVRRPLFSATRVYLRDIKQHSVFSLVTFGPEEPTPKETTDQSIGDLTILRQPTEHLSRFVEHAIKECIDLAVRRREASSGAIVLLDDEESELDRLDHLFRQQLVGGKLSEFRDTFILGIKHTVGTTEQSVRTIETLIEQHSRQGKPLLVLADLFINDTNVLGLLQALVKEHIEIKVLILTGQTDYGGHHQKIADMGLDTMAKPTADDCEGFCKSLRMQMEDAQLRASVRAALSVSKVSRPEQAVVWKGVSRESKDVTKLEVILSRKPFTELNRTRDEVAGIVNSFISRRQWELPAWLAFVARDWGDAYERVLELNKMKAFIQNRRDDSSEGRQVALDDIQVSFTSSWDKEVLRQVSAIAFVSSESRMYSGAIVAEFSASGTRSEVSFRLYRSADADVNYETPLAILTSRPGIRLREAIVLSFLTHLLGHESVGKMTAKSMTTIMDTAVRMVDGKGASQATGDDSDDAEDDSVTEAGKPGRARELTPNRIHEHIVEWLRTKGIDAHAVFRRKSGSAWPINPEFSVRRAKNGPYK